MMAKFIPELTQAVLNQMSTSGERKVAKFLHEYLDDDCVVWCNVPLGHKRLYADFLVLIPNKGLLCLEVKDWHLKILRRMDKTQCQLEINGSLKSEKHPLEQARAYIQNITNLLSAEKRLQQKEGKYQGNLLIPYAYGVVFTSFSYPEIQKMVKNRDHLDILMPRKNTLYKNDLNSGKDKHAVQNQLWNMFTYDFGYTLKPEEIDLIRWHLFPEIRLNTPEQKDLFDVPQSSENLLPKPIVAPDIIKIMDIQQEQLARSLGEGHRMIHGVAGSGKTLILLMRCQYLAQQLNKPILILCYNIVLAAKLRAFVIEKGLAEKIEVYHFHKWCSHLCKTYGITITQKYNKWQPFEQYLQAAIDAMKNETLPKNIYGAVLIDEGHDFEADWLRLATYTLDSTSNHLLLLYDDAQAIYHNGTRANLGFSLASAGIKAQGRTTILRLNYRNTKEIIGFAYLFAYNKIQPHEHSDKNQIPLIKPKAAGVHGKSPYIKQCNTWQDELNYLENCLTKWLNKGIAPQDIAILCYHKKQCHDIEQLLKSKEIPHYPLQHKHIRHEYKPNDPLITISTIHSSKGLEFQRVILMGIHTLKENDQDDDITRLLYVGMTRAQSYLMIILSGNNAYHQRLLESHQHFQNTIPLQAA